MVYHVNDLLIEHDISNQLGAMNLSSEDPEENWTVFQKVVHSPAATTIGHPSCKHQDWFDENDEEIKLLLEEKHCLHKAHQDNTSSVSKKAAYNNICKTAPKQVPWHARLLADQENRGTSVFCRPKGYEEVQELV